VGGVIERVIGRGAEADLIIGFNIKGFDYRVLGAYTERDLGRLPTFDMLEDIHRRLGFRLGLDHLARETLGTGKTADGLQAVFAEEFEKLGGTITDRGAIQVGETDFTSVLTKIGANSPDVLYFPVFTAEGALIAQQAKQVDGLKDTILIGSDGMLTQDFVDAAGDAAEGMYLSGPDLSAFSGNMEFYRNEFLVAYQQRYGQEPAAAFHAHSYDAATMLFQAIDKVAIEQDGTLYIPRSALRDALFATQGRLGITGELNCNANGDCQSTATIGVYQVTGGTIPETPVYSEKASLEG
jgi:branched-chain amino acid transport system substrate-binding protein